jgi:8-oxo-dGTP pyrophosphatase MutT (NUDIX family)
MTSRHSLINSLNNYQTPFLEEKQFCRQFAALLLHPRSFHRDHLPGHITGSAWIIDETKQFALLTHHAKLNKWLQPGGHADGNENVMHVALQEAQEETGLKSLKLIQETIFDIDIHTIPARNGFPEHLHYDIRFLFEATRNESFTITQESHDLAWIPVTQLAAITGHNNSILRMAEKVQLLA